MSPAIAISTAVSTVWTITPAGVKSTTTSYSTGPLTVFVVSASRSLARHAYETFYGSHGIRLALGTYSLLSTIMR